MDVLAILTEKLTGFLRLEGTKTREEIAGYIVGELVCDYDNKYEELEKTNLDVASIAEIASDLEWSNGNPEQLEEMWREMKQIILGLRA